jgi:hypothetical protein
MANCNMKQESLTKEQKAELEKRRRNHLSGKSKSYKWPDAKRMIKSKKRIDLLP